MKSSLLSLGPGSELKGSRSPEIQLKNRMGTMSSLLQYFGSLWTCVSKNPLLIFISQRFSVNEVVIWRHSWPRKIVWNICTYFSAVTGKGTCLALLRQGNAFTEMMVGTFISSLHLLCWQDKAEFPLNDNEVSKNGVDSQVYSARKESTLLFWWMVPLIVILQCSRMKGTYTLILCAHPQRLTFGDAHAF